MQAETPEESMTERTEEEKLRRWVYRVGWKGAGVSKKLRDAMRELKAGEPAAWWRGAEIAAKVVMANGIVGLMGSPGRGKSLMGALLLLEYWRQSKPEPGERIPPRPKMLFASQMLGIIKDSLEDDAPAREATVLRELREYPLLVIDETHERGDGLWSTNMLIGIIKAREARQVPTVLITNETPQQFADNVSLAVMDRIAACGGLIECGWANLRETRFHPTAAKAART